VTTIKDFHIRNNYIVKITDLDDHAGCSVIYPQNVFNNTPLLQKTYFVFSDPCVIEIFECTESNTVSRTIDAVRTNIRLLVIQDIFLTTYTRGISKDLILIEGSKTLFDMLEIPQTEEERKLETQLFGQFRELLVGNVVTSDIDGYNQVLLCFENGGL
jgi:hypothetical protein